MKFLVCLFVTLGVAYGAISPRRPNCANVFCTMDLKICPDGTPAPVPVGGCCPSLSACKPGVNPFQNQNCAFVMCTMVFLTCPDGRPAPVPAGGCCPSLSACGTNLISRRSNPLGSLGSLLSGSNLLQTLSSATHGTNLGTVISVLNLLNNVQQLSNDVHQIPLLINQTLAGIVSGTGQAGQIIVDQLIGALNSATHQAGASRDLLGALGHNANLLSGISNLLPKGTSISTVLSVLKVVNQLLELVGIHPQGTTSRNLLGSLGQNANLLSGIGNLLPKGTSISTVLSVLKLLGNINALNNDIHQIPVVINQTLASLVGGAGQASQIVVNQLLELVGIHSQANSRNLLGALGQNANLLSSISHLLPKGTSISTVLSLLNLLNNVNALNNDIHQIPVVLQETLQSLLSGVQNLIPPVIQPVEGSA